MSEAVERIEAQQANPRIVITCEHASNRMPAGWSWPQADQWLSEDHWAWDPGAADLARALAADFGAPAVLSRFSRLLADPNRPHDSPTLFRDIADGRPVAINVDLDEAERNRRLSELYTPYHDAVDAMVGRYDAVVLSMHTFTPVYEGEPRQVEVGVLHHRQPLLGQRLRERLAQHYDARDNEPWDGRLGLMYAPQHHADRHGRRAVELEIRQDLATDPAWRAVFIPRLAAALRDIL